MNKLIRKSSMFLAVILILSSVVGCSGKDPGDTTNGNTSSTDGNVGTSGRNDLIVGTENEPPSLSTTDHDSLAGVFMNLLVFNGLTKINSSDLTVVPDLAESIENEDEENWVFTLKEGVKFHDGTVLTADDVVATIEWAKTFPASSNYTSKMVKVEAIDATTVRITTDGPYAGLLYDLGYHFNFIVPKALIDSGHDFNSNPVGTGPYKFDKWTRGDSLKFIKNEEYFDKDNQAKIAKLEWRFIPEGTSRTIALEAGEIDFIYEVEPNDIARLESNPDIEIAEITSVVNWFLMLNKDVKPFDDINFRKAINTAIDRDAIVAGAINNYGIPNISSVPMEFVGASNDNAEAYDIEKAKGYLTAWGGDPSSVTLPILCSNETKVKVATIMQANLAEIGIKVDIVTMDLGTYLDATSSGNYVSAIVSWSPSNLLTYVQRFHSRRNASNPGSINNPELDALVIKAETTINEADRMKVIGEIIALSNDLSHQPSLYQDLIFRAYNSDLGGVTPSATGYIYFNEVFWK